MREETSCRHIGYSFRLTARVILYAPSHRQNSTYHGLCYTSRGALAGTRNSISNNIINKKKKKKNSTNDDDDDDDDDDDLNRYIRSKCTHVLWSKILNEMLCSAVFLNL